MDLINNYKRTHKIKKNISSAASLVIGLFQNITVGLLKFIQHEK